MNRNHCFMFLLSAVLCAHTSINQADGFMAAVPKEKNLEFSETNSEGMRMATNGQPKTCWKYGPEMQNFGFQSLTTETIPGVGKVMISYRQAPKKIVIMGTALDGLKLRHFSAIVSPDGSMKLKNMPKRFFPGLNSSVQRHINYALISLPQGQTTCCGLPVFVYIRLRLCSRNRVCMRDGEFIGTFPLTLKC